MLNRLRKLSSFQQQTTTTRTTTKVRRGCYGRNGISEDQLSHSESRKFSEFNPCTCTGNAVAWLTVSSIAKSDAARTFYNSDPNYSNEWQLVTGVSWVIPGYVWHAFLFEKVSSMFFLFFFLSAPNHTVPFSVSEEPWHCMLSDVIMCVYD